TGDREAAPQLPEHGRSSRWRGRWPAGNIGALSGRVAGRPSVTALTAAIREKGHWRIVVRPATYVPDRVPYASLRQTIEKSVVQLRGWDFPHLDRQRGARHGNDWVGGETDWSYYKEAWRFSVTGQFVYLVGIHED